MGDIKKHEENYWHIKKPDLLLLKIFGISIWIGISVGGIYQFRVNNFALIIGSTLLFIVVTFGTYILGNIPNN